MIQESSNKRRMGLDPLLVMITMTIAAIALLVLRSPKF